MNRQELQEISRIRRREAAALLKAKHFPGAYYLMGYAVECALKACIAKQTQRHDFPDKERVHKAYVHDLEQLLKLAGLASALVHDMRNDKVLAMNWTLVKDWHEACRYSTAISDEDARALYAACVTQNGILAWIRTRW